MSEDAFLPINRGFDSTYGHLMGGIGYFDHGFSGRLDWHRNSVPLEEEGYSTTLIADEAIKINNSKTFKNQNFLKINGFIGLPTLNKSNYSQQYLFINGRSIQDRNLSGAIRAAYRDTLPKGRFPIFCLFIDVPPEFIDVNVHPGKLKLGLKIML